MDRVAVFVDAGYLFAQGSALLHGQKLPRSQIELDLGACVEHLRALAKERSGLPLLRIYWYDGTSTGPSAQHTLLAYSRDVKVRLGFVNSAGEQKGVDSLIVTDMIALARNRGMADAVLISGDEDLRVGVQQAQELGVRVHLVGIRPARGSQSTFLLQESDTTLEWDAADISGFMTIRPVVRENPGTSAAQTTLQTTEPPEPLHFAAVTVYSQIAAHEIPAIHAAFVATRQIPAELDRQLLGAARNQLGVAELDSAQKKILRAEFIRLCQHGSSPQDGH